METIAVIRPVRDHDGRVRFVGVNPGDDIDIGAEEELAGFLVDKSAAPSAVTPELISREVNALERIADLFDNLLTVMRRRSRIVAQSLTQGSEHLELARADRAERAQVVAALLERTAAPGGAEQFRGLASLQRQIATNHKMKARAAEILGPFARPEAESVRGVETRVAQREPAGDPPGQGVGTDSASDEPGPERPAPRLFAVLRDMSTAPNGWVNHVQRTYAEQIDAMREASRLATQNGGRFLVLEVTHSVEASPRLYSGAPDPDDGLSDLPF